MFNAKIIVVPAAAAAIWAIATSPEYKGGTTNPAVAFSALQIGPDGSVGLEISDRQMRSVLAAALQEARRYPLSSYPFAVSALAAERSGDEASARVLMLRAMRLKPRSPAIRAWLAYSFAESGDLNEAVRQAARLYYLAPAISPSISPLLARVAQGPAGRQAIKDALGGTPHLMVIAQAVPQGSLGPAALLELLETVDESQVEQAQVRVVQEHLAADDYEGARRAWTRFLPAPKQKHGLVYDGYFAGLPGAGPFNWQFASSGDLQAGVAASGLPNPPTALRVERVGARAGPAAWQNVVVVPGRYRLSHLLRFETDALSSAAFAWRVKCEKPSSKTVASFPLEGQAPQSWTRVSRDLDIPTQCKLATLELVSTATDASIQSTVLITDLSLTRLK